MFGKINAKTDKKDEKEISFIRFSVIPNDMQTIRISQRKTTDLLAKIANETDPVKCVDTIITETADGKMAYNTYLRLANQGIKVQWFNAKSGKLIKKYDTEFRAFASRVGKTNSSGIDGLVDQLHGSAIARTGMAVECLVSKKADGIDDVVLVDPASIIEYIWLPEKQRYAMYQQPVSGGAKVDLMDGNFFFVPTEPKAGYPNGTLKFEPAISVITQYLKLQNDSTAVLDRIGYPRYNITVDVEKFVSSLNDRSPENISKAINEHIQTIRTYARQLHYGNDFACTSDVKVDVIGGGVNGSGIDVRAWFEALDPQICNAFQLTPVLMGRLKGGSYSLGSVEFKIVTDTVDSMRRGSKRILEDVFKLWARTKGYDIYPKVEHNPIDWEKEVDKLTSEMLNLQKQRRLEEYGYISKDTATMETVGAEKADNNNSENLYEYLTKKFTVIENVPVEEEILIEETEGDKNAETK